MVPTIDATVGSDETSVHAPVELDVGTLITSVFAEVEENGAVTFSKAPSVGSAA